MKAARHLFLIFILAFFLVAIAAGIMIGGDGGIMIDSSAVGSTSGEDATATYGAEQFHLQLTAVSRDQITPAVGVP
jgi:hypothetical protein